MQFLQDEHSNIQDAISAALGNVFPVRGRKQTLQLKRHWIEDDLKEQDFEKQKARKLAGGTWSAPVFGELELVDNETGKVVDVQKKVKLLSIPKKTHRESYIVRGNEYQVKNQLRRLPGVYTFRMKEGADYKTEFNLAKGKNFNVLFDPATKRFTVKAGGTKRPLYSMLKGLGVGDADIEKSWGRDILEANRVKDHSKDLKNLVKALTGKEHGGEAELKAYVANTQLRPDITKLTVGSEHRQVTPQLLIQSASKLKDVYRGVKEPDDAESLVFKELHGVDDFIKERLVKNVHNIQTKIKRRIDNKAKVKDVYSYRDLNDRVESFFLTDERSNPSEQYNPAHMLGSATRTTIMGPGGVKDTHQIKDSMRDAHPSHLGFLDPIQTPESEKVGATLNLPISAHKRGNKLVTALTNVRSGRKEYMSPQELFDKKVAFPDQADLDSSGHVRKWLFPNIKVKHQNQIVEVPRSEVDYILPSTKSLFSTSSNLIPFIKNNQANRAVFAAKQIEQAVPLKHREVPLVQPLATKTGKSFVEAMGNMFSFSAPEAGVVKRVSKNEIVIQSGRSTHRVPIYHNFPLNQSTFMHAEPVVKPGQKVAKGQLLADSNFTKNGTLALGSNLKTAYMVWPGATFEDGVAISETGAKKLTSEHMYTFDHQAGEDKKYNLASYSAHFPQKISADNKKLLDKDGVIQVGSVVQPGHTLVASLKKRVPTPEESVLFRRHRGMVQPFADDAVVYDNDVPGVVTDVIKGAKGYKVLVKTEEPARVGDKLSGLHGNKGIISEVIPDHLAPKTKDGKPIDLILNPHGVISRINVGQIYESAAAKLAKAKGSPYKFENFDHINHRDKIAESLNKFGLSDKEAVFDASGSKIGDIHVGYPHIIKLFKTGQSAFSSRGVGPGYQYEAMTMQPTRGGKKGAKRVDPMTTYALLSHDARNILREMATVKSEHSPEFWEAVRTGKTPPPPKPSFVYNKFLNMLQGAGVDVHKDGTRLQLLPQTDAQVASVSKGPIQRAEFVNAKDLSPRKGGFFDEKITGGLQGNHFNHIDLPEKLPNPVFETPIKKLLNLSAKEYSGLLSGTHSIGSGGRVVRGGSGPTGGAAFEHLLGQMDVDKELEKYRNQISTAKGEKLKTAYKNLRYLTTLKEQNLKPTDAYLKSKVAVVPAMFRPIYPLGDTGDTTMAPVNWLYQNTHLLSEAMQKPAVQMLPREDQGVIRHDLYNAKAQLAGVTGELATRGGTEIPGVIQDISGLHTPKGGFFQRKVLGKKQEPTARGTIIPSKSLGVDEIGIPEKAAWSLFEPFVMRRLVQSGMTPKMAQDSIQNQTGRAKEVLQHVMSERPVLYNRAPSLHKFSIMGAMPKIVQGNAVHIPHLVVKGFNADFDGDQMTIHVPVLPDAVKEAKQMLPSKHLIKPGTNTLMMMPAQEGALGIYLASQTDSGRAEINKLLPHGLSVKKPLNKGGTAALLDKIAQKHPTEYASIVEKLKNLGEVKTYHSGFTLGLNDLKVDTSDRDIIMKKNIAEAKKLYRGKSSLHESNALAFDKVFKPASQEIQNIMMSKLPPTNPLKMMVESGARGNKNQLQQILMTPVVLKDSKDRPQSHMPISKSYAEGLDVSDYFTSTYGARKGMVDRSLQTSLPGDFTKSLMANTLDNVIAKQDCGVKSGIRLGIHDPDLLGRFSAGKGVLRHNTAITGDVVKMLERRGVKDIEVRSPLKCLLPKGTCAKCFGHDEHGKLPHIGRNVGALAGQSLTEPLTQMQMTSMHTGGMAGASMEAIGFERIKQMFDMTKFTGEVPVAMQPGKVTAIKPSSAGGHEVTVGEKTYHVRQGNPLTVKVGQSVPKGEPLALGVVRPESVLKTKGIAEAQNYIVDQLKNAYKSQNVDVHRKMFETVVRSTTNTTLIKDAPAGAPFSPGDIAPLTMVKAYNTKHKKDQIKHEPTLVGLSNLPGTRKNWMAQLGYRYGKKTLQNAAAEGWHTDVADYHPIPAFAHGASFGRGGEGKY